VAGGSGFRRCPLRHLAARAERRRAHHDRPPHLYQPSPPEEAFRFCDTLLGQPHCQIVEPGERHWDLFRRLCLETNTHGSRVTDAWFAALAIEWGCEWVTMDRDYARFPGLRWAVPTK
jgi:predicted nucleic acid-binding protein